MNDINILKNEAAMAILQRATDALNAIGVHCHLSPMALPHGMTVNLHAGSSLELSSAARLSATIGAEVAHSGDGRNGFATRLACLVSETLTDLVPDQAHSNNRGPKPWELVGHVPVESGKLVLIDPRNIDDHWEVSAFEDIRVYKHSNTCQTLRYGVDFMRYDEVIPAFGSSMNQLRSSGQWEELPVPVPEGLNYNAVCRMVINQEAGEIDGVAVGFGTGYGDGHYPVFARRNDDGRIMQVLVDFLSSEDDAIALGMIRSDSFNRKTS